MRVVINIEADGLNPKNIWCVVCKDLDTGERHIWRRVTDDQAQLASFVGFAKSISATVGHNILGYDLPAINNLLATGSGGEVILAPSQATDTLIISKMVDYSRKGHSTTQYAEEFGIDKPKQPPYKEYSEELVDYCILLVDITEKIYDKYKRFINNPDYANAIALEHRFQLVVNSLHSNGFSFNTRKAQSLLDKVTEELNDLDRGMEAAFPAREVLIRNFIPKLTKHGTISRASIPRSRLADIHTFEAGKEYKHTKLVPFNPSSHKQLIDVLTEAGWVPIDKTQTHIDNERELNQLKRDKSGEPSVALRVQECYDALLKLKTSGWKINENNLSTLPSSAPPAAKLLAKRILYEARRRTLTEWLGLIHCEIKINKENLGTLGIETSGTQIKNGAIDSAKRNVDGVETISKSLVLLPENLISNIPTDSRSKRLLGWLKSKKVNVDFVKENKNYLWITVTSQEQFEVFSALLATEILDGTKLKHLKYEVTSTRIKGEYYGIGAWTQRMSHQKPNTANIPNEFDTFGNKKLLGKELRSLWQAPRNRLLVGVDAEGIQLRVFAHLIDDAEFTDALVKGKKDDKTDPHSLNQRILGDVCRSRAAAKRFIYALLLGAGLSKLAEILGTDGRQTQEALDRLLTRYTGWKHLKDNVFPQDAKRGYFIGLDERPVRLPGESQSNRRHLAMSGYLQNGEAVVMKSATVKWHDKLKDYDAKLVNFVHDEWQTECPNDMKIALDIAKLQAHSLEEVGNDLKLKCPLAGSYWNDDLKDYTIATNWAYTH